MIPTRFKHVKSGRVYDLVAQAVKLAVPTQVGDMDVLKVRITDFGYVANAYYGHLIGTDFTATLQTEKPISGDVELIMYRGEDTRVWLRPKDEFLSGRFEPMDARAASMMPANYHITGTDYHKAFRA